MGVGQRGLRQLEQQTGMTESDTRELGGGRLWVGRFQRGWTFLYSRYE